MSWWKTKELLPGDTEERHLPLQHLTTWDPRPPFYYSVLSWSQLLRNWQWKGLLSGQEARLRKQIISLQGMSREQLQQSLAEEQSYQRETHDQAPEKQFWEQGQGLAKCDRSAPLLTLFLQQPAPAFAKGVSTQHKRVTLSLLIENGIYGQHTKLII